MSCISVFFQEVLPDFSQFFPQGFRVDYLRILPGEDVVPVQAGQVFGNYAVEFPILIVVDHPLKTGAVIVRAGSAVVYVLAYHMKVMIPRVSLKHGALRSDLSRMFSLKKQNRRVPILGTPEKR